MPQDRVAILIVRDSKLLLMHRHKHGQEYYAVPGGKMEPGETPQQTAVREIQEETGLSITLERQLGTFRNQDRTEYYFLAKPVDGEPKLGGPELLRQSPENHYELEWVAAERVAQVNLMPPQIRTMCADVTRGEIDKGPWL